MFYPQAQLLRYLLPIVAVGVTTLLFIGVKPWIDNDLVLFPYLVAVVVSALFAGAGPGMFAAVLSLGVEDFVSTGMTSSPIHLVHNAFYLFASATIVALIMMDRRKTEQERSARDILEQREFQLRTVIQGLQQGVYLSDPQGNLLAANDANRAIWGSEPDSEHTPRKLALTRALRGERVLNEVAKIETPEGEREILLSATPVRFSDGPVFGAVVVSEDVTERGQAIKELRRSKEEAEAANLTKDRFLAVLSHELRTPLTPVLMLAESLETNPQIPSSLRADASMIRRHVALEARLIDDLLDLTRIEKGKLFLEKHPVSVHDILPVAVEMMKVEAEAKEITIHTDLGAERPFIDADRARIKQVILNILGNAVKFTAVGGLIFLKTRNAGGAVQISITDTGIGISPFALKNIFNAFEQSDANHRRFGGLGLGLAITRSLVELHGGEVYACSEGEEKGATFIISLPGREEPVKAPLQSELPIENEGRRLRILLVEDHEPTAFVLARLLKRRGHQVRMAASISEAKGNSDFMLDLLVSDIGLPDGSGIDVITHFRAHQSGFRAIALSGFGMENDIDRSLEAGFDRHLTKPVDFVTLQKTIGELFEPSEAAL